MIWPVGCPGQSSSIVTSHPKKETKTAVNLTACLWTHLITTCQSSIASEVSPKRRRALPWPTSLPRAFQRSVHPIVGLRPHPDTSGLSGARRRLHHLEVVRQHFLLSTFADPTLEVDHLPARCPGRQSERTRDSFLRPSTARGDRSANQNTATPFRDPTARTIRP